MQENIVKETKEIVADVIGETPELLNSTQLLEDFGVDDLDKMQIIVSCEERFNISFSEDDFDEFDTIGKLITLVKEKTTEK